MNNGEGIAFSFEFLASKNGGKKVPFIVELGQPISIKQGNGCRVHLRYMLDGVVHRKRWADGKDEFQAVCLGIKMVKIELEHFYFLEGYKIYRRLGKKEEYSEVGLEDIFPYAKR